MLTVCFYTIAHLQKASITPVSENLPDSQSSAYRRKHYHLFKQNVLSDDICKNTHFSVLNLIFGKNLNHEKNLQNLHG